MLGKITSVAFAETERGQVPILRVVGVAISGVYCDPARLSFFCDSKSVLVLLSSASFVATPRTSFVDTLVSFKTPTRRRWYSVKVTASIECNPALTNRVWSIRRLETATSTGPESEASIKTSPSCLALSRSRDSFAFAPRRSLSLAARISETRGGGGGGISNDFVGTVSSPEKERTPSVTSWGVERQAPMSMTTERDVGVK